MSKTELADELAKRERRDLARSRRISIRSAEAAELTGFAGGAVALGYAAEKGFLPDTVGGIDSELLIGVGLLMVSRGRSSKRAAMMRGAAYAALAGGLKDMGRKMGSGQSLFG